MHRNRGKSACNGVENQNIHIDNDSDSDCDNDDELTWVDSHSQSQQRNIGIVMEFQHFDHPVIIITSQILPE
ncbi:hypothetical protein IFR05_012060, partial [Cadophora sp. M221]